jgi:anti-anti-sigma regulatory factor
MKAPEDLFEQVYTEKFLIALQSKAGAGEKTLEVDCSECLAMSAYTISRLVSLNKQLKNDGGKLLITSLRPNVRELFKLLHLDELLSVS